MLPTGLYPETMCTPSDREEGIFSSLLQEGMDTTAEKELSTDSLSNASLVCALVYLV